MHFSNCSNFILLYTEHTESFKIQRLGKKKVYNINISVPSGLDLNLLLLFYRLVLKVVYDPEADQMGLAYFKATLLNI